jgi:hypothetical protein
MSPIFCDASNPVVWQAIRREFDEPFDEKTVREKKAYAIKNMLQSWINHPLNPQYSCLIQSLIANNAKYFSLKVVIRYIRSKTIIWILNSSF